MKQLKVLLISFVAFALVAGCKPSNEKTTAEQMDKVKTETKEASQNMKDYAFAQKAEFTEKMKVQLTGINKDMDVLEAKIEKASDAVKAEAKPKLQALRDQAAQLNTQLEEVKNASESTWDTVKASSKKTYESLKEGFQQSRQWLSDKIAP